MTVVAIRTRSQSQWGYAQALLRDSLAEADHSLLNEHAAMAERFLRDAGRPTPIWATRIAAIAVVAARRADAAPTITRRMAYFDVATAATDLLVIARDVYGVVPDEDARAVLAGESSARLAKV